MAEPFPPLRGPGAAFLALPLRARLSLRGGPGALPAVAATFGVAPPTTPLASAASGDRAALWLGPDEWLLLAEDGAAEALAAALASALAAVPGSVVDVSHRQHAFALSGPAAATALNEGCPLDLDPAAFPPGACTRTLFGKTEIVLWRRAPDTFEVEVARSFAAALQALLAEVLADLDPADARGDPGMVDTPAPRTAPSPEPTTAASSAA